MKNVPKLRFNGFSDEWKSELVGELFSEVRNGFVGTATPYYVEEGVPYLQSNNIRKNKIDTNKMVYITKEFHLKNKKSTLKKGDILMVQSGHAGECAVVPVEFEGANCHALIVMTPKKNTNSTYCSYYINSELGQRRLFKLITGNTIKHILASEIKEFKIKAPTAKEQEKIANFLTKVDKIIEKQDEKVSNLEQYKKGMMQKIFSKEIRFKKEDGGEYPEWEYKKFKDITKKTGPRNKDNKQYTVYSISNKHGFIPQDEQFEGSRLDSLDKSAYKIVKAGDFAYNPARINVGSLGFLDSGEGIVSSLYVCFRLVAKMNNKFYMQYLSTYQFNKDVLRSVEGGVRDYLFYENFIRIIAPVPCIEEQTKIANFLSNIDLIVEKEKEKLEELKTWKKGLLQGMFV